MRKSGILVVGYLSVDTVQQAHGSTRQSPGGAALYAALGARQAGAAVDLAASIGTDYPAAWLAALKAEGIGLDHIEPKPIRSRWASIRHHSDGRRESTHYADPAWWAASAAHQPDWPTLEGYGAIVACPMPVSHLIRLLDDAETARVPVIADTSEAFARSNAESLLSLLHRLDVFAPSREETRLLCPGMDDASAARSLAQRGVSIVQKLGSDGVFVVDANATKEWRLAAFDALVVDPTGAGDATVGALAAGRLRGGSVHMAARESLRIGALAVSGMGPAALGPSFRVAVSVQPVRGVQ
jgi:sugar/nucleoside kinase (ribokinase family)